MSGIKKYWTTLCLQLHEQLNWSPQEVIELVKQRHKIIYRWKKRNEELKLFKKAQLTYSPGFYSLGKEE